MCHFGFTKNNPCVIIKIIHAGRLLMKRAAVLLSFLSILVFTTVSVAAAENFYDDLSQAQRYDLADAYTRVAVQFDTLGEKERAEGYRNLALVIFPGFGNVERPAQDEKPVTVKRPEQQAPDPSGGDASYYYFNKLLRGVFNENKSLTLSVIADPLYLPLFDAGVEKTLISSELDWFFDEYDVSSIAPYDVFQMNTVQVTPLDNGYWRLDVQTLPEYADAVPEITFWAEKMGFYFRKFPEGWRLAAIGPVA